MEVLSKADTLAAIAEATAPLVRDNKLLWAAIKSAAIMVDSATAMQLTGIKHLDTLKKHLTPVMKGREYTWSAVEIAEYNARKELIKYDKAA